VRAVCFAFLEVVSCLPHGVDYMSEAAGVGRNSEAYCAAAKVADYAALIRPTIQIRFEGINATAPPQAIEAFRP
jgi:hypothetical protein